MVYHKKLNFKSTVPQAPIWTTRRSRRAVPLTKHELTFNIKLANGDLEIIDKLVEVQKMLGETRRPRGRGSAQ